VSASLSSNKLKYSSRSAAERRGVKRRHSPDGGLTRFMDILICDLGRDDAEEGSDPDATRHEQHGGGAVAQRLLGGGIVRTLDRHSRPTPRHRVANELIESPGPVARGGNKEREVVRGGAASERKGVPLQGGEGGDLDSVVGPHCVVDTVEGMGDGEESHTIVTRATEGERGVDGEEEGVVEAITEQEERDRSEVWPEERDVERDEEEPEEVEEVCVREEGVAGGGEASHESGDRHEEDHRQEHHAGDAVAREHRVIARGRGG
jgi:hypothetical protein